MSENKSSNASEESISQVDEDTLLVTSAKFERDTLEKAVYDFANKSNFRSTHLNESNGLINFKIEDIDNLAFNAQTNLLNIVKINNIVRYYVNKDSIIGKVTEAIECNVNSIWKLEHPNYDESEKKTFDLVDGIIKDFNKKINLNKIITESIPMTYLEGNFCMYLRKNPKNKTYQVDDYPLGVCEVSDYSSGGENYLVVNVRELEARLRKVYKKNRNNKALFYKDADDEIKNTFPKEVYKAYIDKEQYAILDIKNTGLMRINNLKRKYGLSPIFKALKSVIRLENIELSDDKNTLVRGKKIIFQKLIKELVTTPKELPNINWSSAQAKAHTDLMSALNSNGVSVYTGVPWVDKVEFVEPKLQQTDSIVKKGHRDQILTSVGISYLASDKGSFGAAQVSIAELLKIINKIGENLEDILQKWYTGIIVDDYGLDPKYCPTIKVIDSEQLSAELSIQLARMLNSDINASLETVYNTLGLDVKTEAKRRKEEQELDYDNVFKPRMTAHTNSGKSDSGSEDKNGRPKDSKDIDKQNTDQDYNKENNR